MLKWTLDRLHRTYHRSCKDPESPYFVPGVDPDEYAELVGVDTEAAEQIFHIADRWQTVLSNASPVHQELLLLLFAHEHNKSHSCIAANRKYAAYQRDQPVKEKSCASLPAHQGEGE
eukprot:11297556-Karenia_brevis.AAC.1